MATIYVKNMDIDDLPERKSDDVYLTPYDVALMCLKKYGYGEPKTILDPSAGPGVWGDAARTLWPNAQIVGMDIRDLSRPASYDEWYPHTDYRIDNLRVVRRQFDLIVGNDPYKHALEFVRIAYERGQYGFGSLMLKLLPSTFAWTEGRAKAFKDMPLTHVVALNPRIQFYGNRNPNLSALYVWDSRLSSAGGTRFNILNWKTGETYL